MSNRFLFAAASGLADTIANIDGSTWGILTCSEIDSFAVFLVELGRAEVAASIVFRHAHIDSEDAGDDHAEIGEAARKQASMPGIESARDGWKLAAAYVAELV